ncbi:NADPH-dependent FMN reductase [Chryseobacterium koreense]|uniref:NADPH-dependent FMN reductase n=1 Tax=Chryseobacterium koreense CCUG 49689 TaxID=1304281 RepID=A0A0J7LQ45_9FLAO|nr:NAD(P)H-dependent oxidoreductase [Chryseobacterium koreense]KMQ71175.1 NADPH-dependent FMN reductase [Chryseobacterium koreense CCUG 49689]MBB5332698.1 NAD(P)H-dependent FMN reductase [Chryseobacterium koreense]
MKIIAFAGSNSDVSINRQLVTFASGFFSGHLIEILDLNDYEMPIYKNEREIENGIPQLAHDFAAKIDSSDLILLSLAENNGAYSAAFKNVFDWVSRISGRKVFAEKPMFLMATSPGKRGGSSVLEIASKRFPFDGAKVLETFSLPSFNENFDSEQGIVHEEKLQEMEEKIEQIKAFFKK